MKSSDSEEINNVNLNDGNEDRRVLPDCSSGKTFRFGLFFFSFSYILHNYPGRFVGNRWMTLASLNLIGVSPSTLGQT